MAYYSAGDVIRLNRIAVGMTQEELSEGICSVETLSRIENGHHKIKKETYQHLMERMNRMSERNYAICTGKDMEFLEEDYIISNMIANYDYEQAEIYLEKMERKIGNDLLSQQYFKRLKAIIDYNNNKICIEMYVQKLEEIIAMTVSDYEKYLDGIYPFTEQEAYIIMNLGLGYGKMGHHEKCLEICQMILRCIEEGYMDSENGNILKVIVMRNMSYIMGPTKRYQEAIHMLQEVYEECLKIDYGHMIPIVLGDIAWNMMKQIENGERKGEDIELVKKYLRQSYYTAAAKKGVNLCKNTREYWKVQFGE